MPALRDIQFDRDTFLARLPGVDTDAAQRGVATRAALAVQQIVGTGEQVAEARGMVVDRGGESRQGGAGALAVFKPVGARRQSLQHPQSHRTARRHRGIAGRVPGAAQGGEPFLSVVQVEAPGLPVPETRQHGVGQLPRPLQPLAFAGGVVELQQPLGQVGIVLQVTRGRRAAVQVGAPQSTPGAAVVGPQEAGGTCRRPGVARLVEQIARLGQGGDH